MESVAARLFTNGDMEKVVRLKLLILLTLGFGVNTQLHGPTYLLEPPSQLTFSNTTGSQVSCAAHGSPDPQVDWLLHGGNTVFAVPGLRQSLGNGTLYFPPFRAEDYRADVHSTIYRCRASNIAGTILSREVHVQAVVSEHYEVNVHHNHVIVGNTAVLTCVIPPKVKEHVTVTSWSRDESILLPGLNLGGRIVVTYGSGELLIRSTRQDDSVPTYSCLTIHSLTQERKRSEAAHLTVIESAKSFPPRLASNIHSSFTVYRQTDIHLTCTAEGNPPPNFSWYRDIKGHLKPVYPTSRFEPSQDVLLIKRLRPEDSGRWTCKVFNSFGEQRLDIYLNVIAHLSVHVMPQLHKLNTGEHALFNCTVSGTPVGRVQWLKDGEVIIPQENGKIQLLDPTVLKIKDVTRHDKGMYQCVVSNEKENFQGTAELQLGDTIPEMQYNFIEQAVEPGVQVSLRCSAIGSPPPQFKWLLDEQPLADLKPDHRYTISQYLDYAGDVIAHLNITNIRVEDGGFYTCMASNTLGSIKHSSRLNVYGPPFIRSIGPAKAVAGTDAMILCPYSGYPIKSVRWERHGQELPQDMRHRIEEGGALTILKVDQNTDKGFYTCYVTSREGHVARKEIQLIVNAPPVMEPFNFPASIQEGGRAQVTCTVTSGDLPINFFWHKDERPIPASLEVEERSAEFYSMLVFKNVNSKHTGAYTCIASNPAARVNYTAQLMVKVTPQWTIEPQNISTLLGNSLIIPCEAKGFPEPTIIWLEGYGKSTDYRPISGKHRVMHLANGSLWFEMVSSKDEGYYLCRATNGIGSGLGKVIYVAVKEPARFEIPYRNISVKRGGEITLLCHVHGDVPIEVVWDFNDSPLDLQKLRFSHVSLKKEKELKSQLTISRTDREDSGIYKCLAENAFGRSEHVINLAVQEKPDPPSHLEAVEALGRSVRLSWRKPFDGNSPIIGYIAQYKKLDAIKSNWENRSELNLSMSAIIHPREMFEEAPISGLKPSTVYKIRIAALNIIDKGDFTEPVIVKTLEERPSGAPVDVKVEAVSSTELFVQWSPPPRSTWNGELLGYTIHWREHHSSDNKTNVQTVNGWATNKFEMSNLRKFTTYDITINAFNRIDNGPPSPSIIGTTKEGIPEVPPQDITCSEITSQNIKLSWKVPPQHLIGGIIQGYKIFYKPTENKFKVIDLPRTGEVKRTQNTETYLHGLEKFCNYSIKMLAYTSAGDGVASDVIYCCTEEDVPGKPANVKAASLTGESILVSWLAPLKENGHIIVYNIYYREAGQVDQHESFNVRIEDIDTKFGLSYEVRNLQERHLYEFWVSATTKVGEGETTGMVVQQANSRATSRITSFSQTIRQPNKSQILLPCVAVGNPTPRTRWTHRKKTITFSDFYEVTLDGHLYIHDVDISLTGNYTCAASNLFGNDTITYILIVLMPPKAPTLEVEYATSDSIKVKWTEPANGGSLIQGYILIIKDDKTEWRKIDISSDLLQYTIENLKCGTLYFISIAAHNRVGNGSLSVIISAKTKGGPPLVPKEDYIFEANSTAMSVILNKWPSGGCTVIDFALEYKSYGSSTWFLIARSVSTDRIVIENLLPATWYQVKVTAKNDAGLVHGYFTIATYAINGSQIPKLPKLTKKKSKSGVSWEDIFLIIAVFLLALLFITFFCIFGFYRTRRNNNRPEVQAENIELQCQTIPPRRYLDIDEKTAELENMDNLQPMYMAAPPAQSCDDEIIGDYEISPYATFTLPESNKIHSVPTPTDNALDHVEEREQPKIIIPKVQCGKGTWHKNQHYYNNETQVVPQQPRILYRSRQDHHEDTDSEDTSGSGPSAAAGIVATTSYRTPKKRAERIAGVGYTGYETLLVADILRNKDRGSSTESNDVSPLAERRQTPRHMIQKRHYRTASSSSYGDGKLISGDVRIKPPGRFSDGVDRKERERERDLKSAETVMPPELNEIRYRYQKKKKEAKRKQYMIHV